MPIVARLLFAGALVALSACTPPPALKEYAYPAWGFAVSFRAPPQATDYPGSADGAKAHTFLVESVLAGRDNLVNVIDGSGSSKSEDQALSDAPGALASDVGGTLGPITYAATGAVTGREFLLSRPNKPTARVRVFVSNKHLYELISQSSLGPDDPETTSFLDSFRLLPPG
ncbi:MAG TPA: hypothetical protein VHZ26_08770 [Caulobacteraceae bacterium]|jgi:hypothetical protein|nr:hypothetical protein [Caulobacteraceae bacterium]